MGEPFPTPVPLAQQSAKKWHPPVHTSPPKRQRQTCGLDPHKRIEKKHEFRPEVSDYSSILRIITKIKSVRLSKAPSTGFCTPIEFKQIRVSSIQAEVLLQRGSFQLGKIQLLFQSLPDKFCSSFSRFRNRFLYSIQ